MSDWDFLGPMGCGYFHQAQLKEEGLKIKILTTQAKLSTTICVGFQQVFSFKVICLRLTSNFGPTRDFNRNCGPKPKHSNVNHLLGSR